ncbi:MAG: hypothetical protein ABFD89_18960 [Bryobacteraceae bacterium]
MKVICLAVLSMSTLLAQDAYVKRDGNSWSFGTSKVERTVKLDNGRFYTGKWTDLKSGRELLTGIRGEEFAAVIDGAQISGLSGGWTLVSARDVKQSDGSQQLDVILQRGGLEVMKSFVVYPSSSIIREWATFRNLGSQRLQIDEPRFLTIATTLGQFDKIDFHWMTGGENCPGSWVLKTEALQPGSPRRFDSYDPFPGTAKSKYGFRMGSASYAPWNALFNRSSGQGVFIGFDYFGHWMSGFSAGEDGAVRGEFRVAGHHQLLAPSESLVTPKAFTGLYTNDLDNAGNECLDWQYRYLWDYTRADWFPAIRMLGWWWNGTPWKDQGNTWVGGNGDQDSAFRKVFRVADLMSQVGADVYHRDWGWWDRAGDWGSPDFKRMGEYLRKHAMGQLIYAFIYTVDTKSRVAREHPDWVLGTTLDMSNPMVVQHLKNQLDNFAQRFGTFEWRNDSTAIARRDGFDTPLLGQDQGFREILRGFLDSHPDCAFQGVNGGGNLVGYDYARYASSISFSDGAVGVTRNHWASLILPPDKASDIPDVWQPNKFDKSSWRGLLTMNFDMTGDTLDPAKLEGLRELIDIYHYLGSQGVVGRWVHVYRPEISGDDAVMYFERLSGDGKRGVVIPKHVAPGPVTIRPKGLNASAEYLVSFQESGRSERRSGADIMKTGIRLEKMVPGELIYLNLPYHPGSKLYKASPALPVDVRKQPADNMGYPGIELKWNPSRDQHWLSYYEVLRDGSVIDKVAKGTYYFDHSAGASLGASYAVRAVNGGGLRSGETLATGPATPVARVLDDALGSGVSYLGEWQRETGIQPAHMGTLSKSGQKGADFEFTVDGARFTWFTRLCNECGKAEVTVDGRSEAVVDTYSADDIFGVGIYSKSFSAPGTHRIRIRVLGEHGGPRGKGTLVYVDGVRMER